MAPKTVGLYGSMTFVVVTDVVVVVVPFFSSGAAGSRGSAPRKDVALSGDMRPLLIDGTGDDEIQPAAEEDPPRRTRLQQ